MHVSRALHSSLFEIGNISIAVALAAAECSWLRKYWAPQAACDNFLVDFSQKLGELHN